ncbi:hypothetical protein BGP_4799 [Beggiatoa sp. PS]|nr:hypothetical protein BGP_4799 [Beggiatoa sp. PS]
MSFKTDIVNVVLENGQFPVSHKSHQKKPGWTFPFFKRLDGI